MSMRLTSGLARRTSVYFHFPRGSLATTIRVLNPKTHAASTLTRIMLIAAILGSRIQVQRTWVDMWPAVLFARDDETI